MPKRTAHVQTECSAHFFFILFNDELNEWGFRKKRETDRRFFKISLIAVFILSV